VVALGNGRFDVCPVETGVTSGNEVEILQGLQAGQQVVVSAQFMIDSEANVDAAALRLGSGKPGCAETPKPAEKGMTDKSGSDMSMPVAGMSTRKPPAKKGVSMPGAAMNGTSEQHDAGHGMQKDKSRKMGDNQGQQP
jgi:Cu(I)/Ag(I) efflux system membrane fusion protein